MNKQELIEKYKKECLEFRDAHSARVFHSFWDDLKKLDEPQKPVVPQFVADWYEKHKDDLEYDIWEYILHWGKQQKSEFYEWMNHANNKPFQTLANMHQFGYEVEKEKRYLVKVIGMSKLHECLNFDTMENRWKFFDCDNTKTYRTHHTRKELEEASFGEVFNSSLFEVEEVE